MASEQSLEEFLKEFSEQIPPLILRGKVSQSYELCEDQDQLKENVDTVCKIQNITTKSLSCFESISNENIRKEVEGFNKQVDKSKTSSKTCARSPYPRLLLKSKDDIKLFSTIAKRLLKKHGQPRKLLTKLRFLPEVKTSLALAKSSIEKRRESEQTLGNVKKRKASPVNGKRKELKKQQWFKRQNELKERREMWDRKQKEVPCKYFISGRCRKGETCLFNHDSASTDGPPLCDSVRKLGQCNFNPCPYSHNIGSFPCVYFHSPGYECTNPMCRFSHKLPLTPTGVRKLESVQRTLLTSTGPTGSNRVLNDNNCKLQLNETTEPSKVGRKVSPLMQIRDIFSCSVLD